MARPNCITHSVLISPESWRWVKGCEVSEVDDVKVMSLHTVGEFISNRKSLCTSLINIIGSVYPRKPRTSKHCVLLVNMNGGLWDTSQCRYHGSPILSIYTRSSIWKVNWLWGLGLENGYERGARAASTWTTESLSSCTNRENWYRFSCTWCSPEVPALKCQWKLCIGLPTIIARHLTPHKLCYKIYSSVQVQDSLSTLKKTTYW